MNEQNKELLIDLCARLPFGLMVERLGVPRKVLAINPYNASLLIDRGEYMPAWYGLDEVKPLLRPLSSMTEEEQKEFVQFHCVNLCPIIIKDMLTLDNESKMFNWLHKHHFDYKRKDMYKEKGQ